MDAEVPFGPNRYQDNLSLGRFNKTISITDRG